MVSALDLLAIAPAHLGTQPGRSRSRNASGREMRLLTKTKTETQAGRAAAEEQKGSDIVPPPGATRVAPRGGTGASLCARPRRKWEKEYVAPRPACRRSVAPAHMGDNDPIPAPEGEMQLSEQTKCNARFKTKRRRAGRFRVTCGMQPCHRPPKGPWGCRGSRSGDLTTPVCCMSKSVEKESSHYRQLGSEQRTLK